MMMDVRTLSLGLLMHGPMSGYEIKKRLETSFRHFVSAGYGSIYPALADLAAAGLVTVRAIEQDKRPHKKLYAITPAGRERLVADLMATPPRHRVRSEFLVLMYFAHLLPPEKVEQALDAMIDSWERWLGEDIQSCEESGEAAPGVPLTPGMEFAVGYGRAVLTAALAYVKQGRGPFLAALAAEGRDGRAAASPAARAAE
jgi:DNA-binding PadR family transcriptional regulator